MIDASRLPRHVAIIMDGNGRWARARGAPRIAGHQEGARSVREVVRAAREIGLGALTLFAFSEQNWDRPPDEVDALMELLYRYILEEHDEIMQNGIRLTAIGALARLPAFVRQPLYELMKESSPHRGMVLCLALSYGGREDVLQAARRLAEEVREGRLDPDEINEVVLGARLGTAELPPLDLLIRTSGEFRLSNFLLWQAAYAELYFTPVMWPDFRRAELEKALQAYSRRERRFGLTTEQVLGRQNGVDQAACAVAGKRGGAAGHG
jgi:undecaprenyl diphosphate synthase